MRVIVIVCAFVLITACAAKRIAPSNPTPVQPDFIKSIAQVRRSVVPIVCVQQPQGGGDSTLISMEGTAFFILQDGTFATAGHVIRDLTSPQRNAVCPTAAIYLPEGGWVQRMPEFRVRYFFFSQADCTRDEALDIAICKAAGNVSQIMRSEIEPVILEPVLQEDGTPAAFTGFPQTPLSFRLPLTSRGFIGAYVDVPDSDGPRQVIFDKAAWPGASGSPIYLEN